MPSNEVTVASRASAVAGEDEERGEGEERERMAPGSYPPVYGAS